MRLYFTVLAILVAGRAAGLPALKSLGEETSRLETLAALTAAELRAGSWSLSPLASGTSPRVWPGAGTPIRIPRQASLAPTEGPFRVRVPRDSGISFQGWEPGFGQSESSANVAALAVAAQSRRGSCRCYVAGDPVLLPLLLTTATTSGLTENSRMLLPSHFAGGHVPPETTVAPASTAAALRSSSPFQAIGRGSVGNTSRSATDKHASRLTAMKLLQTEPHHVMPDAGDAAIPTPPTQLRFRQEPSGPTTVGLLPPGGGKPCGGPTKERSPASAPATALPGPHIEAAPADSDMSQLFIQAGHPHVRRWFPNAESAAGLPRRRAPTDAPAPSAVSAQRTAWPDEAQGALWLLFGTSVACAGLAAMTVPGVWAVMWLERSTVRSRWASGGCTVAAAAAASWFLPLGACAVMWSGLLCVVGVGVWVAQAGERSAAAGST